MSYMYDESLYEFNEVHVRSIIQHQCMSCSAFYGHVISTIAESVACLLMCLSLLFIFLCMHVVYANIYVFSQEPPHVYTQESTVPLS